MKAAVLTAHRHIEFQEIPEPEPGPDEAKIRVVSAGICGSELHAFKGTHPFRHPPAILGHEMAGDIVAVGSQVKGFRVGDRVTVEPQIGCGVCTPCQAGHPNLCMNKTVLGTQVWIGAYAEYIVAPERVLYRIPDHVSYDEAVMIEPLAVGVHAVKVSGLQLGQSAIVLGGGTIGLCALVAAREAGVLTTVVTDVVDYNLAVAREMGATATVNAGTDDVRAAVDRVTGGAGVDVALVAVGLSPVVNQGLSALKRRGQMVIIGIFEGTLAVEDPYRIVGGELVVRGSNMYTSEDVQTALDLIAAGRVEAGKFITQRLPMSEVQRGFEIVDKKLEDCVKVVLHW
ncbi:MAG: alcohol dehydrogenase catalytic domain-containing protein [Bacteroidetes bacterium]|nr:alcohol dehydrogenase catalytic domain-containing protein [Bacteroidota bacterium]